MICILGTVMETFIALFRGINVGGKTTIPMKDLASLMIDCGYENVQTYIRSGNVVFNSKKNPNTDIRALIENKFGFKPEVLILNSEDLNQALENNPYNSTEGKLCYFYFCKSLPKSINTSKLAEIKVTEEYCIIGKVFYLFSPDGIGRSKLAASVERCLGVPATARNLNTVKKLWEIVQNA